MPISSFNRLALAIAVGLSTAPALVQAGFPPALELSTLDVAAGFRINGEAMFDYSGRSISSAGDINGDGIDDLIIGAPGVDAIGATSGISPGASYVVFGATTPFGSALELAALNGVNGFKINGAAAGDESGRAVSAAGDLNGDGIADLIIGAPEADPNGTASGASYVVFGKTTSFSATLELSTLSGAAGFKINGAAGIDRLGRALSAAGDINNDTIDDLIIGVSGADAVGTNSGASYVVFGTTTPFSAPLELAALDGVNGFKINGAVAGDSSGRAVSGAGDINGDGIADLIIGAPNADPNGNISGTSYVVFGSNAGFVPVLELSTLGVAAGFKINGEAVGDRAGNSVSAAGDINGDGMADLIIGAYFADPTGFESGASYVVFGTTTPFGSALELSDLNGANGFKINGATSFDYSGISVSGAGDISGDGIADLVIGAPFAGPGGNDAGASYVVFGNNTIAGFVSPLELSALNGANGFTINGAAPGDESGSAVSIAGDINSDGAADLIISARNAKPNGSISGASYVIFGQPRPEPIFSDGFE